jgi:hypothetical protein
MDPAAKPSPTDCQNMKWDANMKTGTAISGCGMEVKIDHRTVPNLLTPRGISTSATASPSGMLCIARDAAQVRSHTYQATAEALLSCSRRV